MSGHVVAAPLSCEERRILLIVARRAILSFFQRQDPDPYPSSTPALVAERASFVTLREAQTGHLRGCRGECPARRPLIESVARMAVAAAQDDPRFQPVGADEVDRLVVSISALGPILRISPEEVVVGRHGLLITRGNRAGLLLPQVPESLGWDRLNFLEGVGQKAGLSSNAWRDPDSDLYGFEAETWSEAEFTDVRGVVTC